MIPADHLWRRINVFATAVLADLHEQVKTFYSDIGRPSIDPEITIRILLVVYCYGIRHERRLCEDVALHLAYRWSASSIYSPGSLTLRCSQLDLRECCLIPA